MNLEGNHDNCNPHLAIMLPEIIGRIATFLPRSDLLTCTLVNTSWETEIRKHLLALSHHTLTEDNIATNQKFISIRNNCPRSIEILGLETLFANDSFANFISENGHIIKTLQTDLILPSSTWPRYLQSLSNSFPNMTSLVLNFEIRDADDQSVSETQFPPEPYSFSKVIHLGICSYYVPNRHRRAESEALFSSIIPQLVPLFPNLVAMSFSVGESVVQNSIDVFPTLTRLKFFNKKLAVPLRQTALNVTRLEIGYCFHTTTGFSALLKMAATLEHLTFFEVSNARLVRTEDTLYDTIRKRHVLHLPILPKLRVFELVQDQCTDREEYQNSIVTPDLVLKFEGGDATRTQLDYRVHLPVLETIRISKAEMSKFDNAEDRMTEQEYFEASVSFLYAFFLHESNSSAESMKQLDVPFPPGDTFRLARMKKCECGRGVHLCECFEWKDSSEFWDRVVAVFPNLVRYAAMGGAWERPRKAKVKQWVELGEELGFVKEIKGKDPEGRADLNFGDEVYLEVLKNQKFAN